MFHVFQSQQADARSSPKRPSRKLLEKPRNRPVKIPHACTECKRRKIRCDGGFPCGKCISRDIGSACVYARQRERIHPSKKKIEGLSRALEEHRTIVDRLFPEHNVADLLSLPRHDLIDMLIISDNGSPPPLNTSWLGSDQASTVSGTSWLPSPPPCSDVVSFDYQDAEFMDMWMNATSIQTAIPAGTDCSWLVPSNEDLAQFGGASLH